MFFGSRQLSIQSTKYIGILKDDNIAEIIATKNIQNLYISIGENQDKFSKFSRPIIFNDIAADGVHIMHAAAYYNALDIFIYLHKVAKLVLLLPNAHDDNPLHYACANDASEVVAYILSQMIDEAFQNDSKNHQKYLTLAASSKSARSIQLLCLKGINLHLYAEKAIQRSTLLCDAASLSILLSHHGQNKSQTAPINSAIVLGRLDSLKILVESGFSLDQEDDQHFLPLFRALNGYCINYDIVKFILKYATVYDIEAQDQMSAVHFICKGMNAKIAKEILSHNIDVNKFDEYGNPGPYYFFNKNPDQAVKILDMLYERGFNVNIKNKSTGNL